MVTRANRPGIGVGGHIATYASAASLYEVGFNHFFRGKDHAGGGRPGLHPGPRLARHLRPRVPRGPPEPRTSSTASARSCPTAVGAALPSYPHPRLMPDFWEFPTVSMGLGPINAIYQARFNRYLHNRGIKDTSEQHVWAFLGDGEMDEPESLGAIGLAAREELDNLTFVINCNLQRLDGPVRGNGKIIQELESYFRGAGWNVIKVVWGRDWDPLLAADVDGVLVNAMNTTPDGQFQTYTVETGAYIRENFFGRDPRLRKMVEHLTDEEIRKLSRGGHDYRKVYAAFKAAREHVGQPTVILAHTIKGWTLREDFEARNATHQMKKLTQGRPQGVPRPALPADLGRGARGRPAAVLPPGRGLRRDPSTCWSAAARSAASCPAARCAPSRSSCRATRSTRSCKKGSGKQKVATTMAFVRLLKDLMRDPEIGNRFVPIIPDEAPHLRHGLAVPDARRSTRRTARPTSRRPRAAAVVQGVDRRPDPARGHQRGRLDGVGDRRGHVVRHARRADDPDLHLLLDVRLPAHRRRRLGARRPDGPRLPARRHRRPHHAQRRGPAARGRALAAARLDEPGRASPTTRRWASRSRTSSRTACGGCTARTAGERLLLPDGLQRALPAARRARGPRRRGPAQGSLPLRRRRRTSDRRAAGADPGVRRRHAVGARGPADAGRGVGRGRRRLVGDRPGPSCAARRWPARSTTCCTPTRSRACRT